MITKVNEIIERICPMTILLNVGAVGVSLTDIEMGVKLLLYTATIVWTVVKISKEIKFWNDKTKS